MLGRDDVQESVAMGDTAVIVVDMGAPKSRAAWQTDLVVCPPDRRCRRGPAMAPAGSTP